MRLSTLNPAIWPFSVFSNVCAVVDDANDLIKNHGGSAYQAAQFKSFYEDIGLMQTPKPGHWNRVAREIARRSGRPAAERKADFTPYTRRQA